MRIQWNGEPKHDVTIVEVRKGRAGNFYLADKEYFEFTLSPDLVRKIVEVYKVVTVHGED